MTIKQFYFLVAGTTCLATCLILYLQYPKHPLAPFKCWDLPVPEVTIKEYDEFHVPNIVHFVRLGNLSLSFIEVVCIRAAWLQQNPDILMIHCDNCSATTHSPHWTYIKNIPRLSLRHVEKPEVIFGTKVSWIQHASDIVRIRVLRKYGGIYLDSDSYLIRSVDKYRRYELAIGWPPGQSIGNQIIVAHKDSEFLRLYYESYRGYRPDLWYYNAGHFPTEEILETRPYLVYRIACDFGVHEDITRMLFEQCDDVWRNFTAVHAFFRHRAYYCPLDRYGPLNFKTIGLYRANFGQMARLVLTGTTKLGEAGVRNISLLSKTVLDYAKGCR